MLKTIIIYEKVQSKSIIKIDAIEAMIEGM